MRVAETSDRVRTLMEIARVVGSARDVGGILFEVCVKVARLCDAERGTVYLWDEQTEEVVPAMSQLASTEPREGSWRRFKRMGRRPLRDMRLIKRLAQDRRPLVIDDARESSLISPAWVEAFGLRSVLGVPLLAEDRVVGALVLDNLGQVRPFAADQVELATAAADFVAIALQRALLLQQTELRLRRAEARLKIARTLGSTLDLKLVLKEIAQQASRACEMDRCSIYLFEETRLTPVMSQFGDGRVDESLWATFQALRDTRVEEIPFLALATRNVAPVVIQDSTTDPLVPEFLVRFELGEILAVPLIRRESVMGAMAFDNGGGDDSKRPVSVAQIDMATTIASQVALVIENAQLAQETQQRLQQAQAANRAKSEFLANMSHEIRTPLTGVIGTAELLLHAEMSADQRQKVEIINTSAEALLGLIDDILDLSKIEAGKLSLEPVDFDLETAVRDSVRLFAQRASDRGIHLTYTLASGLPRRVHGDVTRLRQILLNLVGNAVKFTDAGSVELRVEPGDPEEAGLALCFVIRDTGIGIPDDVQERLFQPFTQADASTTRRYGGTGLGLTICRRIVELMGGEIGVSSALGEGSTFTFTVPLEPARAPAKAAAEGSAAAPSAEAQRPQRHHHILVAEDHTLNRLVTCGLVESMGYQVTGVADGVEVLEALEKESVDLVLMDCQMPRLDGYEATRRIRERDVGADVPVVALTASALKEDLERCLASGMNGFLSKPCRRQDLEAALDRWLVG